MKTIISFAGSSPVSSLVFTKLTNKISPVTFRFSDYAISGVKEQLSWAQMEKDIIEASQTRVVVVSNATFNESMERLHNNKNYFDSKAIVMCGTPKEIQAVKNLNAGEVFAVDSSSIPAEVAENVYKYILREKGVFSD